MAVLCQGAPGLPLTIASEELRLEQYDPETFTALPSLPLAASRFKAAEAQNLVETVFRDLFLKHAMDRTFGLMLIHRHFDLDHGERLVEYRGTSVPWQCDEISEGVVPTTWLICHNGAIRPYEFSYDPQIVSSDPEPNPGSRKMASFLKEFQGLLRKHNVAGLFGLCRYPGDAFRGRVEITRGRANINLLPGDVSIIAW